MRIGGRRRPVSRPSRRRCRLASSRVEPRTPRDLVVVPALRLAAAVADVHDGVRRVVVGPSRRRRRRRHRGGDGAGAGGTTGGRRPRRRSRRRPRPRPRRRPRRRPPRRPPRPRRWCGPGRGRGGRGGAGGGRRRLVGRSSASVSSARRPPRSRPSARSPPARRRLARRRRGRRRRRLGWVSAEVPPRRRPASAGGLRGSVLAGSSRPGYGGAGRRGSAASVGATNITAAGRGRAVSGAVARRRVRRVGSAGASVNGLPEERIGSSVTSGSGAWSFCAT